MFIKQLSIFIENREGRLEEVTEVLAQNGINIVSFSLADTSEYGMLRMVVSDPAKAKEVLKETGFSAMLTNVIAVKVPHKEGMLNKLLKVAVAKGLSIEYMYALSTDCKNASIVMKVSDAENAIAELEKNGFSLVEESEAYVINC